MQLGLLSIAVSQKQLEGAWREVPVASESKAVPCFLNGAFEECGGALS